MHSADNTRSPSSMKKHPIHTRTTVNKPRPPTNVIASTSTPLRAHHGVCTQGTRRPPTLPPMFHDVTGFTRTLHSSLLPQPHPRRRHTLPPGAGGGGGGWQRVTADARPRPAQSPPPVISFCYFFLLFLFIPSSRQRSHALAAACWRRCAERKASRSPSRTALTSVASHPERVSLTSLYGCNT